MYLGNNKVLRIASVTVDTSLQPHISKVLEDEVAKLIRKGE